MLSKVGILAGLLFFVPRISTADAQAGLAMAPGCLRWGCDLYFDVTVPESINNSRLLISCAQGGETVWTAQGGDTRGAREYSVGAILGYHDAGLESPNLLGPANCRAVLTTHTRKNDLVLAAYSFTIQP